MIFYTDLDAALDLQDPNRKILESPPGYRCLAVNEHRIVTKETDYYALGVSLLELAGVEVAWLKNGMNLKAIIAQQKDIYVREHI